MVAKFAKDLDMIQALNLTDSQVENIVTKMLNGEIPVDEVVLLAGDAVSVMITEDELRDFLVLMGESDIKFTDLTSLVASFAFAELTQEELDIIKQSTLYTSQGMTQEDLEFIMIVYKSSGMSKDDLEFMLNNYTIEQIYILGETINETFFVDDEEPSVDEILDELSWWAKKGAGYYIVIVAIILVVIAVGVGIGMMAMKSKADNSITATPVSDDKKPNQNDVSAIS